MRRDRPRGTRASRDVNGHRLPARRTRRPAASGPASAETAAVAPSATPAATHARWSAAVPLESAGACVTPRCSAAACSNAWMRGPMVSQPLERASIAAFDLGIGKPHDASASSSAATTRSWSGSVMCGNRGRVTSARATRSRARQRDVGEARAIGRELMHGGIEQARLDRVTLAHRGGAPRPGGPASSSSTGIT